MSLSNAKVNRLLNDDFVCAYVNTQGDPNSGESFSHRPRDPVGPCLRGNGEHNVQMITMSPSGEIFHVLSGYVGPEELLAELQFAQATWEKLAKVDDAAARKKLLIAAHEKFARELEDRRFDENDTPLGSLGAGFKNMQKQFQPALGPEMQNLTASFTGQRAELDHGFVIKHPLLKYTEYRSEDLVGSAKSFFGSAGFGTGGDDADEQPAPRAEKPRKPKKTTSKRAAATRERSAD